MTRLTWRQVGALAAVLAALGLALARPPAGSDGLPVAVHGECAPAIADAGGPR